VHTLDADECEWDPAKARANVLKHGVRFPDAAIAVRDELALTYHDPDSNGEVRYVSIGRNRMARILVTVFTLRGDKVRIISARKASLTERRLYRQR
jgi:uncharacterized protein